MQQLAIVFDIVDNGVKQLVLQRGEVVRVADKEKRALKRKLDNQSDCCRQALQTRRLRMSMLPVAPRPADFQKRPMVYNVLQNLRDRPARYGSSLACIKASCFLAA